MIFRTYVFFALASVPAAFAVDFEKDILPIFEEHCFSCHGPKKQKGEIRLDRRAHLLRGGDSGIPSVIPGDSAESYLIELFEDPDPEFRMPFEEDPLSSSQIALIEEWIDEGANWPGQMDEVIAEAEESDHWSFQPVERPKVPIMEAASGAIDAFLLAKLDESGLTPNSEADARSLIRRASIILTGLPPVPEKVTLFQQAFVANPDGAYEALVDELMASPHFGERWAQHWLDVIRWAETNGSEANLYRKNAWVYRDYVTDAFNEDKPYDRFIREQIAGDSLDAGEATGFLVAGPHVPAATVGREESAIRQARADRMDEIMQTVGASMMGMTLGCARCHNHKFDPISITDYYSMTGVFQDIEFGGRTPELPESHPKRLAANPLWQTIAENRAMLVPTGNWEEDWGAYRELHFESVITDRIRVTFLSKRTKLDELEVFGPKEPMKNFALSKYGTKADGPVHLRGDVRHAESYVNDGEYGTMAWTAAKKEDSDEQPWIQINFSEPVEINRLRMSSNREYYYDVDYLSINASIGFDDYRLEALSPSGEWIELAAIPKIKQADKENPKRQEALAAISEAVSQLEEVGPKVSFVGRFIDPATTRVLSRGSPENPRNEVPPAAPLILGGDLGLDSSFTGSERRARFAEWVVSPDNPLTSRVMVNRIWHHIFGMGIVPTTSDFGKAGMSPSHPELLDWLASEFEEPKVSDGEPWSMKSMIRLIVMSDAFRRSSAPSEESLVVDAGASLLWRFPPRRVEAEVIRDGVLLASGKLDTSVGGPSFRIHNVKKTYAQWEVVNNYGPDTWRRMLYQERMRRVDDQMFTAFDFPDCGQVRAMRPVSTTPLQALNLLNSPFVREQAEQLASRVKKEASSDDTEEQIRRSFQILLNREPDREELAACKEVVKEASLALVCRTLINSNEFAFLP
ncbi:MAG: hypothetical protein CMI17_03710 [Opitutaceae bacterium]|nr:hypothetical protein [Opitutaceae bacterium]|tara:strand:- start:5782 stop:8532 length:2751 start_codon:yes stop_codon:yes gene_type:complete